MLILFFKFLKCIFIEVQLPYNILQAYNTAIHNF